MTSLGPDWLLTLLTVDTAVSLFRLIACKTKAEILITRFSLTLKAPSNKLYAGEIFAHPNKAADRKNHLRSAAFGLLIKGGAAQNCTAPLHLFIFPLVA